MTYQRKYQHLRIELASPEQIQNWGKRILPTGEIIGQVTKPYTLHYKTHKPEKDGLFCERIFGPIKSGVCICGKYQGIENRKDNIKFCEHCGVEFIESRIRRYRMGYIELACPVTHVWYLKRLPSCIANLALKALEQEFTGVIKCVYIDPPFNTGEMFDHYDDGVEHSLWLSQMRDRLTVLHRLLANDGTLFVHIDDNELAYLTVLLDEIFARNNHLYTVTVQAGFGYGS